MEIFHRRLYGMTAGHKTYEYTVPGTYNFYVPVKTEAFLAIVGSGGNRDKVSSTWYASAGGAAFVGRVYLPAGKYMVIVGGIIEGSTSGNHSYLGYSGKTGFLIDAEGGSYLQYTGNYGVIAFPPAIDSILEPHDVQINSAKNLASANRSTGGASLYMGYGKGSDKSVSNYTTGYFKVEW